MLVGWLFHFSNIIFFCFQNLENIYFQTSSKNKQLSWNNCDRTGSLIKVICLVLRFWELQLHQNCDSHSSQPQLQVETSALTFENHGYMQLFKNHPDNLWIFAAISNNHVTLVWIKVGRVSTFVSALRSKADFWLVCGRYILCLVLRLMM